MRPAVVFMQPSWAPRPVQRSWLGSLAQVTQRQGRLVEKSITYSPSFPCRQVRIARGDRSPEKSGDQVNLVLMGQMSRDVTLQTLHLDRRCQQKQKARRFRGAGNLAFRILSKVNCSQKDRRRMPRTDGNSYHDTFR